MMEARTYVKTAMLLVVGFAAGVGVLGFRAVDRAEPRPGLEAYRSDAVAAVDPERTNDADEHSNSEITVVMEARNICRDFVLYSQSDKPDAGALETRLRDADARARSASQGEGESASNIDELVRYATSVVERAREAGSVAPVVEFVRSECDPRQDYTQPILATDR
jgi:hypothetical protein